jgi:hypothetical protein
VCGGGCPKGYNWYSSVSGYTPSGTEIAGTGDPFTDSANEDFTLAVGTTPIDAGSDLSAYVTVDKRNYARDATFDIGAYEYGASSGDETAPTVSTATIDVTGTTLTIVFSEPVIANVSTGFVMTMNGGAAGLTYVSGSNTNTLLYNITGRAIDTAETGTLAYTQPGNGIEDTSANDLASFFGGTAETVTNNSDYIPSATTYTVTSNSTLAVCPISPNGAYQITDGDTTEFVVTCDNGWTGTFSGCGGSDVISGQTHTYTTNAITGVCSVTFTPTAILIW